MNSSTYNEEEFESLNDIETVLSSIGIKLRENAKEWRDIDDVLQDIADSWDNWDKTTQNAVATAVAGTRQRENVLQLFDNWDEVDKYAEIAANSYGTATEKMKAYTDSVEAAQQRIQVAIENWALLINGAGYIKDFYNAIGFAIENIQHLIAVVSALAIVLNLNGIINTFSNGLTIMASKLTDIGMLFDKAKLNLAIGGTATSSAKDSGLNNVRENFIFAQQQMFGQALQKYTNTLNQQDAQAALNMQKEMLRMSATDKLTVAESLLTNVQLGNISDESKKHLANALTLILQDGEQKTILQKIASGQELSDSEDGLAALNYGLAELRKKQYKNAVAENMNKSSKMGEPGSMIANGVGMLIGGGAGAFGFASMGENLLGDQGKIYGTMLGSMIGSYAGKALATGITTAVTSGVGAGLMAIPGLGWAALAATVFTTIMAGIKRAKEKAIEEAEEEFKKSEEKYSNAKGSNVTAKQYDELAKGVDSLGRNISLTDEEYQSFLDKSNELAELFPELIVRTDEQGNKLIGLGNIVGSVSEKVAELNRQLLHESDADLLDRNLLQKNFDDTYSNISDLENKKNRLKNRTANVQDYKEIYDEYGISYTDNKDGTILLDYKDRERAELAIQDTIKKTENEIRNLKKEMSSYTQASVRELGLVDQELQNQINSMSDEEGAIYQNIISGMELRQVDENGDYKRDLWTGKYLLKSEDDINKEIKDITNLVEKSFEELGQENIDIAFKSPESYDTLEEMQKARQQLMDALISIFGADGVIDDTEAQVIIGLGFEVKDNTIEDPQDILGTLQNEMGVKYSNGNNISIENLQKLNFSDMQKAMKMLKDETITTTTSMDTLVNMLYADRPMPTTLSGMTEYVTKQGELLGQLGQKVTDFFDNNTWQNINANEYFSEYPEAIRNTIAEAQEELKDGGEKTQEMVDEIAESAITSFQATLFNNLGKVEELKLDKVFGESITSDIDGFIDSFSELKTAIEEISSAYEDLSSAQKEQATNGKLSLQTVLDLVTSNENYLRVLDFETDSVTGNTTAIKLQDDAAKKVALAQMQTVQSNLKLAITENEATIASNEHRKQLVMQALEALQTANANEGQVASNQDVAETTVASTKTMGQYAGMLAGIGAIIDAIVNKQWGSIAEAYNNAKNSVATQVDDFIAQTTNYTDWQAKYGKMNADELYAELDSINEDNERLRDTNDIYKYVTGQKLTLDNIGDFVTKDLGADSGSSGNAKTPLEKLQDAEAAINKEREAMRVFGTGKETAYFEKMKANLSLQKDMLKNLVATAKTDEERLDYQKQLEEVEVKIANLDDEQLEDKKKNLETLGATLGAQIAIQRELIKASDTEEELIERQKELNDLLKQEQELRKNIRAYQRELIDTELEYESGTPDSKRYKELIEQKEALYAEDMAKAKLAIQDARNEAYQSFKKKNLDSNGNALYTDAELWDLANNSDAVQEQVKNYIEAFQGAAELAMQVVDDNINAIEKKLDKLENRRPNEWTSISDINDYYNDRIELLNDKIDIWEEALEDTSNLTDEQITSLVDSLNEATKSIQEAKIARLEDIKEYDDKYYSAITWQVNQYIDEIELAKKANDKWYDDAVKKLQDYNENLDRTNELLELQNKLKTVSQEKERVYREGLGWVYEAPRQKIKEAQDELDKFYRQDQINDLNNTKDAEDKILDERIQNWQDYLTMLENKYGEYEALENQRILMERMNVETQEEIDAIIKKDMEDFVTYTDSKMNESIGNYYEFYTKFESWFDDFFEGYTDNLSKLAELNEQFLSLLDLGKYLKGNGMNIEGGLATLGTLSKADREAIFKKLDMSKDYSREMEYAIRDGNYSLAQEYALLREAKAEKQGITLGQGNYRTNEQVWDDAMNKYGKTYSEEVNKELVKVQADIQAGNAYSKAGNNYASQNVSAINESNNLIQGQTGQLSNRLTDIQTAIIKQTGYTIDSFEKMANQLSVSIETVLKSYEQGGNGWVDGSNMSNEELEGALADGKYVDLGGGVYLDPNKKPVVIENVDKDPGVVGSQAWLDEVRKEGWSESKIESVMASASANGIKSQTVKNITSMKRNTDYAGKTITTGGYTVEYDELGYAVSKVKNSSSVRDDGKIIYTSPNGTQREVSKELDTSTIESNIKVVSEAMRNAGYKIDTVGGVIATQIASSINSAITKEQANALAQQIKSTEISHNTASLVNTSSEANQIMSGMTGSIDTAISYLKNIDSKTVQSLNNSYSYSSGGSSSSGGGSSSSSSSSSYSKMSAQGGANTDYSKANTSNSKTGTYDKYTDYSAAYEKATTKAEKDAIVKARDDKIKNEYGGKDPNPGWKASKGYSTGLERGPVTYTGLAMLHGTSNEPEYVLNNDQAYNLLYNLSMSRNAKMAEFEPKNMSNGIQYIVQGDIILEGVDNPAEFWQEVTNAMGNRWNVTKNR